MVSVTGIRHGQRLAVAVSRLLRSQNQTAIQLAVHSYVQAYIITQDVYMNAKQWSRYEQKSNINTFLFNRKKKKDNSLI